MMAKRLDITTKIIVGELDAAARLARSIAAAMIELGMNDGPREGYATCHTEWAAAALATDIRGLTRTLRRQGLAFDNEGRFGELQSGVGALLSLLSVLRQQMPDRNNPWLVLAECAARAVETGVATSYQRWHAARLPMPVPPPEVPSAQPAQLH